MSRKLLLAAVAIAGAVFTAGAAQADPMLYIGVNEGGAPVDPGNTVATSNTGLVSFSGTTTDFAYTANATGTPVLPEPDLDTSTVDVSSGTASGTHTIDVYITETGLTSPLGVNQFISGFTSNLQSAELGNDGNVDRHG